MNAVCSAAQFGGFGSARYAGCSDPISSPANRSISNVLAGGFGGVATYARCSDPVSPPANRSIGGLATAEVEKKVATGRMQKFGGEGIPYFKEKKSKKKKKSEKQKVSKPKRSASAVPPSRSPSVWFQKTLGGAYATGLTASAFKFDPTELLKLLELSSAACTQPVNIVEHELIADLQEMGFDESRAQWAMQQTGAARNTTVKLLVRSLSTLVVTDKELVAG